MANSNAQMVEQAQKRASISGYLSQNPGMHPVSEVADALEISHGSAGLLLYHMAKDGLIQLDDSSGKKTYGMSDVPVELLQVEEPHKRRYRRRGSREVELMVAGTQIIIGRNPETGRLRITLEEVLE